MSFRKDVPLLVESDQYTLMKVMLEDDERLPVPGLERLQRS